MIRGNRKRHLDRLAVVAGFCVMVLVMSARTALAEDGDQQLVGAWTVQVTLRNCNTNAPMGSFTSLVSFHRGGTIAESSGNASLPSGQRSEGHGAWKHLQARTFSQHVIGLIRFSSEPNLPGTPTFDPTKPISPGFSAGWQTISHEVQLTGPDSFESSGTTEFFDVNGTSYRTGCSTAVALRFE